MDPFFIISVLSSIVTLLLAVPAALQMWREVIPRWFRRTIPPQAFFCLCRLIADRIAADNFIPDVVIGLGRGGSVFAGVVAAIMRRSARESNFIAFDWITKDTSPFKEVIPPPGLDLSGKKVLTELLQNVTSTPKRP